MEGEEAKKTDEAEETKRPTGESIRSITFGKSLETIPREETFGVAAQLLLACEIVKRCFVLNTVIVTFNLCTKNNIDSKIMFDVHKQSTVYTVFILLPFAWIADSYVGKINMLLLNFALEILVMILGMAITFIQLDAQSMLLQCFVIFQVVFDETGDILREIVILELFRLPKDVHKVRSCVFLFYILNHLYIILFRVAVKYTKVFPQFDTYSPRVLLSLETVFSLLYFILLLVIKRNKRKEPVYFRFADDCLMSFLRSLKLRKLTQCCLYKLDSRETNDWIEVAYDDQGTEYKQLVVKETKKFYLFIVTVLPLFLCLGDFDIAFYVTKWLSRGLIELPYKIVSYTAWHSFGMALGALIVELVIIPQLLKRKLLATNLKRVKAGLVLLLLSYIFAIVLGKMYVDDIGFVNEATRVNFRIYNEIPSTATLEAKWLDKLVLSPFSVTLVTHSKIHAGRTYLLQLTSLYLNKTVEVRTQDFGTTSIIISKTDVSICPIPDPILKNKTKNAYVQILMLPDFPKESPLVFADLDGNVHESLTNIAICETITLPTGEYVVYYSPIKQYKLLTTIQVNKSAVYSLIVNLENTPKARVTTLLRTSNLSPYWLLPQVITLLLAEPMVFISLATFRFLEIPVKLRTIGFAGYTVIMDGWYYFFLHIYPKGRLLSNVTPDLMILIIIFQLMGMILFFKVASKFKYEYPC